MYVDVDINFYILELFYFASFHPTQCFLEVTENGSFFHYFMKYHANVTFNFNTYNMPLILTPNIAIRILHVEDNA